MEMTENTECGTCGDTARTVCPTCVTGTPTMLNEVGGCADCDDEKIIDCLCVGNILMKDYAATYGE